MNIRIVTTADIGSFIAATTNGNYIVLTLDDTLDIDVGDNLSGTFDGNGDLFYRVRNLTKGKDVGICLENWDCTVESAIESLLSMIKTPCAVFTTRGRYISDEDGVSSKLRRDVLRV